MSPGRGWTVFSPRSRGGSSSGSPRGRGTIPCVPCSRVDSCKPESSLSRPRSGVWLRGRRAPPRRGSEDRVSSRVVELEPIHRDAEILRREELLALREQSRRELADQEVVLAGDRVS